MLDKLDFYVAAILLMCMHWLWLGCN